MKALLAAALLALAPSAFAASPLVGSWNKDGAPAAEVRVDGTATVDGEAVRWKASGNTLTLRYADGRVEVMEYALRGDVLTVTMEGESETYTRAGKAKAAKAKGPAPTPAGKDKLSTMLTGSAWCWMRYNKIAGTTKQERVVFDRSGAWGSGARGETYSSGMHGTAYGQTDSSSGGRWSVKGKSLLMSEGGGALEDVGLSVSYNSNGHPLLNVAGKEYYSCD
ncbi:MAG: hypothetical protein M0D55_03720 [Elusimicrobiota bacterium]|nr:MAG: hypothetical protein M0D55_03720 [Elusimicrobiota bacterium]